MKPDQIEREAAAKRVTRRALLLGGAQLAIMATLTARLRHLQVDQAEEFRLLAEDNRILVQLLPPARGIIYDRKGTVLAENAQTYRIVVRKEDIEDIDAVLDQVAELIELPQSEKDRVKKELRRAGPSAPVTVADNLTWEAFSLLSVNGPSLPGVTPEVGLTRHYPLREDFAHLVGYVGPVSDYDLSRMEDIDPMYRIPRFQLGKSGVEKHLEDTLKGEAGILRVEKNVHGRIIREMSRQDGQRGANLRLTLDSGLQNFIHARLAGESASAVVMDIETGDLLAAASSPTFDPNLFVRGISSRDYNALLNNKYRPLPSKAIQGAYPPGSTFKMITALAALENGDITLNERIRCTGHVQLGDRRFHCWKRSGHGNMDLRSSLSQSCDTYYYNIALRVGIDNIASMARKLGLGETFDLPLPSINDGLVPDRAWKEARRGEAWLQGDSLNASIGQGFVLASPLQLAVMTARIASGRNISPRLVRAIDDVEITPPTPEALDVNENMLRAVRQGMYEVVNVQRGTALGSQIIAEDQRMAGKTGTSQVRSAVVDNDEVPWEQRDHALFVGYAPYDNPKYAICVVVEHGGGGSRAAAPPARDIMLYALNDGLPPLDAYPNWQREEIRQRFEAMNLRTNTPQSTSAST